ncbi:MAG: ABC transporter permease, partial [Acidimicrobiales bacterium]
MLSRTEHDSAPQAEPAATDAGGGPTLAPWRADVPVRVVSADVKVVDRLRDIWAYRSLLLGLIAKELKIKYKNSALGFLWSLLNPAFTLAIYYFVFQIVLGSGIPDFAIFLMCGLLVYNLYFYATMNATGAIVNNATIVKKVAFPREILALASVGAGIVFFFIQAVVLVLALAAFTYQPDIHFLPLLLPAFLALVIFCAALAIFLAAINVYLRDPQHLIEIVIGAAWFWATPIVYPYAQIARDLVKHHIPAWVYLLNPLTDIVLVFQKGIYRQVFGASSAAAHSSLKAGGSTVIKGSQLLPAQGDWWYLWHVLIVLGVGIALFVAALAVFGRLEGNFAEEL